MGQHGARAVWLVIVTLAASAQVACAPAQAQSAPPRTAAAEPLIVDDVIGRTLEAEGLLGALARIDAELGPTLPTLNDEKPRVSGSHENVSAKSPPALRSTWEGDEVVVTWGAPAEDDLGDLPDVQR